MDPAEVSIVIPAFNEEKAIGDLVRVLHREFAGSELIVIDDCSTDRTSAHAEQAGAIVIRHPYNRGYGAALKTGSRKAARRYVLFCDGDGQHRAEDVRNVIAAVDGYEMVVGARKSGSHLPMIRRPGKLALRWFANFLAGTRIPDLNSGLRIFEREVLMKYLHLMPDGFSFSTTSTFAMMKSNRRMKYVPIKVEKRKGASTVSQLRHGPQTLMLVLRLTVLFEPLKVFLGVSGVLFLLSLASLGIDIFGPGGLREGGQGVADTTVLLSIATVIVFMTGLLCDQVSALRRQLHE